MNPEAREMDQGVRWLKNWDSGRGTESSGSGIKGSDSGPDGFRRSGGGISYPRYMSIVNAQNKRIDCRFVYDPSRQRLFCAYTV